MVSSVWSRCDKVMLAKSTPGMFLAAEAATD
jgi:hypothetical protein